MIWTPVKPLEKGDIITLSNVTYEVVKIENIGLNGSVAHVKKLPDEEINSPSLKDSKD